MYESKPDVSGRSAVRPLVIGVGGHALTGKSSLSAQVAALLDWPRASFGDYVRTVADERGRDQSREVLQEIGEDLVMHHCEQFCRTVLGNAGWAPGRPAVLDGVRHARVVQMIRRLVEPEPFVLVLVMAREEVRRHRLLERRTGTSNREEAADLRELDRHSTEREVDSLLPPLASLSIQTGEEDVRSAEVIQWLTHQYPSL